MWRFLLVLAVPFALAGCGAEPVWAPDEAVEAAVYRDTAPPSITLYTMVNNRSGEGAHNGLLINASQRVVFDPAGSWWHRLAPERNDVHFGMTPTMVGFYESYHARETYRVVKQTVQVSPEVAELALRQAQNYGAVPKAFCSNATSDILRTLPGFEGVSRSFFPGKTMRSFAQLPGVVTSEIREDADPDDNRAVLATQQTVANQIAK